MNNKISAVYKITNKITGECYVGSSKDVYRRWRHHKCPSQWKQQPNNRMYQNMAKYGVDQFEFEIIVPAATTHLKICEQEFINIYHPTYNNRKSNVGLDKDEYQRQYYQQHKEFFKKYRFEHKEKYNEYYRQYYQRKKLERQED